MLFLAVTMSNMLIFIVKWQTKNFENYYFLKIIYTKYIYLKISLCKKHYALIKACFEKIQQISNHFIHFIKSLKSS